MKKKVLFLDRDYLFQYINTDQFEPLFVALTKKQKVKLEECNQNVIACFESEYEELEVSDYPNNYLIFSLCSDRFLNHYEYKKREEILGKTISFWRKILDQWKPSCIVNEVCTMEWVEVLYIEAKARGIPYHTFLYGFRKGYSYWAETPFNSVIDAKLWQTATPTSDDYQEARMYYDLIRNKHEKPFYIQNLNNSKIRGILGSFKYYIQCSFADCFRRGFVYEQYRDISKCMFYNNISRLFYKYDNLNLVDSNHEYVYYPMHYEPEATLTYFADPYVDQSSVLHQIALSLGTKQILIVKEHPQQLGKLATDQYRRLKKICPNLMFIRGEVSSYDVLKKINLMVTLNGTAGLEAMIMGKAVIVLGKVFYSYCKSANYCKDFRELKLTVRNRLYKPVNRDDVIDFLARFFSLQTEGFPSMHSSNERNINLKNLENYIFHLLNEES